MTTAARLAPPTVSPDPATWPALIGLEHLAALGYAPNAEAARKAARKWPPELRATGTGRRVLFLRDRVLAHLGLGGDRR